jgi:prepilin-type N-terminal cleavage/methylation domain-containing protein
LRGFTLIELLIVVAIIAILAAIAIVNMRLASDRALSAQCKSRLRTIDYGLKAYRIDYNRYPPADGTAGDEPTPLRTEVGNGPAANGSWAGASLLIVRLGYVTNPQKLYCPVYERRHPPNRQKNFRYAYNNSALDTGGTVGGANNVDKDSGDIWLCRCLWVPPDRGWRPSDNVTYPHGEERDEENVLYSNGRVEQVKGRDDFVRKYPQR